MVSEVMIDAKWCREHNACYGDDKLDDLFDRPMTPREVATRTDGPWASVSARDRLWVLTIDGALPDRIQRLFAANEAERVAMSKLADGEAIDGRCRRAIAVARAKAGAKPNDGELTGAAWAAWGRVKTWGNAAWVAAAIASSVPADRASLKGAAWVAAYDEERQRQVRDLVVMIDEHESNKKEVASE
jgi:hypothetical protein